MVNRASPKLSVRGLFAEVAIRYFSVLVSIAEACNVFWGRNCPMSSADNGSRVKEFSRSQFESLHHNDNNIPEQYYDSTSEQRRG